MRLVENRIKNALKRLYHFDEAIIMNNSHERSITHRLALHIGTVFYEWDVDVEYNRNLGESKTIYRTINQLLRNANASDIASGRKAVYPDIIVHKRDTPNNHLIIEVKKASSRERLDDFDRFKLKAYLLDDSLKYKYAAFIKLGDPYEKPKFSFEVKSREELLTQLEQGDIGFF